MENNIIFVFAGLSALHVATLNGSKVLIGTILDMGADINEQVSLRLHSIQLVSAVSELASNFSSTMVGCDWLNLFLRSAVDRTTVVVFLFRCHPLFDLYLYNAAIYLIPITLEILKISLLFRCHIPCNYYRNSFCYSGAVLWNNLLSEINHG